MKIILEIKFYFISTFRKSTVGVFVNQLIKNSGLITAVPRLPRKCRSSRCTQYDRKHRQWTLWDRKKRRPTARTLSIHITNAVARPL